MSDRQKTETKKNRLPSWSKAELPEPKPLSWRNWTGFVGPGLVMCGIQLAGGEWLIGAEITARYGGGLMWIAAVAIISSGSSSAEGNGTIEHNKRLRAFGAECLLPLRRARKSDDSGRPRVLLGRGGR